MSRRKTMHSPSVRMVNLNPPAMLTIPEISSILNKILPEKKYPDTKKAEDNEITLILFELLDFLFHSLLSSQFR